jgi:hypothetical protein
MVLDMSQQPLAVFGFEVVPHTTKPLGEHCNCIISVRVISGVNGKRGMIVQVYT